MEATVSAICFCTLASTPGMNDRANDIIFYGQSLQFTIFKRAYNLVARPNNPNVLRLFTNLKIYFPTTNAKIISLDIANRDIYFPIAREWIGLRMLSVVNRTDLLECLLKKLIITLR